MFARSFLTASFAFAWRDRDAILVREADRVEAGQPVYCHSNHGRLCGPQLSRYHRGALRRAGASAGHRHAKEGELGLPGCGAEASSSQRHDVRSEERRVGKEC